MPRIVVLGTGTGVGKTFVSVALARALGGTKGRTPVLALKPIETGVSDSARTDARLLDRASTTPAKGRHPLYGFSDPVSPHLAARRSKASIPLSKVRRWIVEQEQQCMALHDSAIRWVLIETAGGAFSPVSHRTTNVDLARAVDAAIWILVAPDALGVLHDVRATMLALRSSGRTPDFVVLTASRQRDASTGTNAAELERLGIARAVVTLPRGKASGPALAPLVRALRKRAATSRSDARGRA